MFIFDFKIDKMKSITLYLLLLITLSGFAQVGINTDNPHSSSILDVQSEAAGVLLPRVAQASRDTLTSGIANSLLLFDTDNNQFYYNAGDETTSNWLALLSSESKRDNHVLVKSESDLPAPSGGVITLDSQTLYEINGTVTLSASIDLNGAYLIGQDTNEDVLNYTGSSSLFVGDASGSLRSVTLFNGRTGSLFNLTAASSSERLIGQSVLVSGFNSIGSVSGYGLVFFNVFQFIDNADGITYTDINSLLLNNIGWQINNTGTYETFTGTFNFIQKSSGFSYVGASSTGIDVSSNPTLDKGVIKDVVFNGSGDFVKPYSGSNTYPGYNFDINWDIDCVGIPRESDNNASGNIYITRNSTTSNPSFNISTAVPIDAQISAGQLFRFSNSTSNVTGTNNVLVYEGKEPRTFTVTGNLSYQSASTNSNGDATIHAFYIRRFDSAGANIEIPSGTEIYSEVGDHPDTRVRTVPLGGKVTLNPGDYIQIYAQYISTNGTTARNQIRIYSVSLTLE